jgi:GT2 family glycosyltransferase
MRADRVPLSIVVATTHPWPEVERTLDSLWEQAREVGAEMVVVDGDGQGLPEDFTARYPGTLVLKKPGASVFVLRALGMQHTSGEIVAITEDHCRVCPDWCRKLLETHRRYPNAAAVGGCVENGSTDRLIDWANYFVAQAPMMPPIQAGEAAMISAQAGMAIKRRVVPKEIPPHGIMEMFFLRELRQRGETLIADDQIVVHHIQSHGFWNTFAVHYHNGRSIAGFRKRTMAPWKTPLRLAACFGLPGFLPLRATLAVIGKGRFLRELALSFPLMTALACCHAAGEFVGHWSGAGDSPEKLS